MVKINWNVKDTIAMAATGFIWNPITKKYVNTVKEKIDAMVDVELADAIDETTVVYEQE